MSRDQAKIVRERPHNAAYMHPADVEALGVVSGEIVAISSRRATVHAVVQEADDLRRGLVSMSHAYGLDLTQLAAGSDPAEPQIKSMGNHTGALASADLDYMEPHSGIPRMSAIPVRVAAGPQVGEKRV